jgi:hypothetical protein
MLAMWNSYQHDLVATRLFHKAAALQLHYIRPPHLLCM